MIPVTTGVSRTVPDYYVVLRLPAIGCCWFFSFTCNLQHTNSASYLAQLLEEPFGFEWFAKIRTDELDDGLMKVAVVVGKSIALVRCTADTRAK